MPGTTSITGPHDLDVGGLAPDFELPDQHRVPVRLSDFRGRRNVLLVFYPWSFSSICTGELCSIRDALPSDDGELQVLAVSVDSVHVARRYGVFDERVGVALRASFVLDRGGRVRWRTVHAIPDARDVQEYREALRALEVGASAP